MAQALTAPNALGPDRLTTPATGGQIRFAGDSTAVAPIDEPMSTTRSARRRRSCAVAATTSPSIRAPGPDPGWESPNPPKSKASAG